jgi:hypothetical protein
VPKLNQVIAIEKGVKSRVYGHITTLDKAIQKPALFNGFAKSYEKKAEDGEDLPGEGQRVQFIAREVLRDVARQTTELFDITARKDWTNCHARGRVIVDGTELFAAPVTFLLFIEKQLTDLRTLVDRLPVLDPAEEWTLDENSGLFKSQETRTHRTKKVQRPIVLYDATDKHPAQTQLIAEDIIAGFWKTIKQSGAMRKPDKDTLMEKIEKLFKAIKEAREEANNVDVGEVPAIGDLIFNHLGL